MKSHREPHRLSSHTQTFKILMESRGLQTLSEFRHLPKKERISQLPQKANVLAHVLLNLWVSSPDSEDQNYIAKIKYRTTRGSGFRLNLHSAPLELKDVSPEIIRDYLSQNHAHNLGAITLINLLLSSHMVPDNLILTRSTKTGHFYFSQGFHDFWADFFHDYTDYVHIASKHSMQDKYAFFIPGDEPWWDIALPDYHVLTLKRLFLDEFIKVFIRVRCTPWFMIEKIAQNLFAGEQEDEVERFMTYLHQRISWFEGKIESFLSVAERAQLEAFKTTHGAVELEKYFLDIQDYFTETSILPYEELSHVRMAIVGLGMDSGIANLELYCHSIRTAHYTPVMKNICLHYILGRMDALSHEVLVNPDHFYWHLLENLAGDMCGHSVPADIIELSLFKIYLFNKAIQFHKNNTVQCFLLKNESFKHHCIRECIEEEVEKELLTHKTPLFLSLYFQNTVALTILKAQEAQMSSIDLSCLQDRLLICATERLTDAFVFILQHFPKILDNVEFSERLTQYCRGNVPEYLEHINTIKPVTQTESRPRAMRRQSFIYDLHALSNTHLAPDESHSP